MTASLHAQQAYGIHQSHLRSARAIELQIFGDITARLCQARDSGDFPRLAAALHDNRRLWTQLAVDVADEANALPQMLRAQLYYLAEFTAHHSPRVLAGEAGVEALISINTAIMQGLGGQTLPQAQAQS